MLDTVSERKINDLIQEIEEKTQEMANLNDNLADGNSCVYTYGDSEKVVTELSTMIDEDIDSIVDRIDRLEGQIFQLSSELEYLVRDYGYEQFTEDEVAAADKSFTDDILPLINGEP